MYSMNQLFYELYRMTRVHEYYHFAFCFCFSNNVIVDSTGDSATREDVPAENIFHFLLVCCWIIPWIEICLRRKDCSETSPRNASGSFRIIGKHVRVRLFQISHLTRALMRSLKLKQSPQLLRLSSKKFTFESFYRDLFTTLDYIFFLNQSLKKNTTPQIWTNIKK